MKTCKIENCNYPVWSKGLCKSHSPKSPIKKGKGIRKETSKSIAKKEEKKEYTLKQWEMFLEIWAERPHYCYESNQFLGYEPLSTMFHHILPKGVEKYKKYALEKWNIVLLDPSIHQLVETNIEKCPKVNKLTKELKEIYG